MMHGEGLAEPHVPTVGREKASCPVEREAREGWEEARSDMEDTRESYVKYLYAEGVKDASTKMLKCEGRRRTRRRRVVPGIAAACVLKRTVACVPIPQRAAAVPTGI